MRSFALLLALTACSQKPDVVVYCSLDQVHAEPILALFELQTGLKVEAHFDVGRNKTVGLVNRLLAEASQPYADVYWNNEVAHTIRLKRAGLTAPYQSPSAADIPPSFKDPQHHWAGFAARARVLLAHEKATQLPHFIQDIGQSSATSAGAMAAPLTGTTLTHMAVWADIHTPNFVFAWLQTALDSPLSIAGGNADAMRRVCEGDVPWCLTDTDDAAAAIANGYPVEMHYLGQSQSQPGVLVIPNTICLIADGPHPEAAKSFIDFALSRQVEEHLAAGRSRQIPLRPHVPTPPTMQIPGKQFLPMAVDWEEVATQLENILPRLQQLFTS